MIIFQIDLFPFFTNVAFCSSSLNPLLFCTYCVFFQFESNAPFYKCCVFFQFESTTVLYLLCFGPVCTLQQMVPLISTTLPTLKCIGLKVYVIGVTIRRVIFCRPPPPIVCDLLPAVGFFLFGFSLISF